MVLTKAVSGLIAVLMILSMFIGCGTKVTGEFTESEVSFYTNDSYLEGTLAVPEGKGRFPAVIILAGSGPFDRNGDLDARLIEASQQAGEPTLALSSTYRDIAEALSRDGIVTLRYDKREVGNSTGVGGDFPEPSLRDLKAAIAFLKEQPSVDASRVALVGHSLGGLWALMEAAENPDIAAVCVMATPAKPMSEVIVEQIEGSLKLQGANETDIAATVAQQQAIYAQLSSGVLDPATVPEPLRYQLEYLKVIMDLAGADYARQITCPALILQGDKDLFTTIPEEAILLEQAFQEGGNDDVTLITFTDLDHVFRLTPDQPSRALYYEDRGPISADVIDALVKWFKEVLR